MKANIFSFWKQQPANLIMLIKNKLEIKTLKTIENIFLRMQFILTNGIKNFAPDKAIPVIKF